MTNPMLNPNYSGVTIQIANPAVYAGNPGCENRICAMPQYQKEVQPYLTQPSPYVQQPFMPMQTPERPMPLLAKEPEAPLNKAGFAYPPQYYLNNYNYMSPEPPKMKENTEHMNQPFKDIQPQTTDEKNGLAVQNPVDEFQPQTIPQEANSAEQISANEDMTKSQTIISELNEREAKLKAEKENNKPKDIIPLTDEYIKSLENYLNNPNEDIRLMASKEILTRLDEDKNRYDDPALNALLNKMLQDPSKLIRISSLSAFSSQLASGNEYTVKLLQNIQANPNADKEDVLQSADILLKMSAGTDARKIPNPNTK